MPGAFALIGYRLGAPSLFCCFRAQRMSIDTDPGGEYDGSTLMES